VPLVGRRRVPFALEDVAQVAAAVGAHDLGARHAQGAVFVAGHGAWDAIEVGRPAAARLELVVGLVERGVAPGTVVDALVGEVLVVLSREGALGAFLPEHPELLCVAALVLAPLR